MPVADRLSGTDPAPPGDRRFLYLIRRSPATDGRAVRASGPVERLTNYFEIAAHNAACGITGDGTDRPGPQGSPRSAVGASPIAGRPIGFRPLALLHDEPGLQGAEILPSG
jgi:hypothetical protein